MTRNTHDRLHDHFGDDLDSNMLLDGATATYSGGSDLHEVLDDMDTRIVWATLSGGAAYLNDLLDVTTPTPASGQFLSWDGGEWVPTTISGGFTDPMTSRGDIIIRNPSNVTARLGIGASGTVLKSDGTDVNWGTVSGGSGPTALDDLTDVNAPSPASGQVLSWDGGAWVAATISGGTGPTALDDLSDVNAPAPASGQALVWNGSEWTSATISGSSGPIALDDLTDVNAPTPSDLDYLRWDDGTSKWIPSAGYSDPMTTRGDILIRNPSNVTARLGIGSSGTVLKSDGTDVSWGTVSGGTGATYLDDLLDVNAPTPASGQVLAWDGSEWTPTTISGGVDAHIADTTDAHDASAVSVLDTGGHFAGSDVETVLGELATEKVAVVFVIDGGGSAITTGIKGDVSVPFACAITQSRLLADQSGSIVIDVWKDTYANFPPTDADSITASAPPTISSATKSEDSTLTGWTKSISAGDVLRFNVDSATSVTRVTLTLTATRS